MTGVPETKARTRLEADERRGQIVAAARLLFAERPYEAVSTGDIAAAAGTTRTNVHYHFRSKRELFLEIIEQFSRIPGDLEVPVLKAQGLPMEDQVRLVLGRWLDTIERNRRMFMTMLRASSSTDPQISGVLRDSMRAWEGRLLTIVEMDPQKPSHHAMIRSFQAMVADATAAWLDSGTLSKPEVLALLSNCLKAVSDAAASTANDSDPD